ncbi:MAG: sugar phosphate isomerase/epimerase [Bacteroidales bacterium]|jgi:sugar phosphate isomerase/epimerase|nr:sugar phosphate isomerase/epimerase [Bacteroidales bacterium]
MKTSSVKKSIPGKSFFLVCTLVLLSVSCCRRPSDEWKLGVQSYTFHKFTCVETLDKLQTLGVNCVEVYFGQRLGEGFGDQTMDFRMDEATRTKLREIFEAKNVTVVACGVVICSSEEEWEQLFRFAQSMGISLITCEPERKHLNFVEQLTGKYAIDIAVHNHPQPSAYWHPDTLMAALEGRSDRMGVCADVGHWKREGIDPVKALEQVSPRLKSLHFKDIKAPEAGEAEQHDVIWGTGVCDVKGMLEVLRKNKFNGLMSIEYEYNWDNSVPDIQQSIKILQ